MGIFLGGFFDVHAAGGAGDQNDIIAGGVHRHSDIKFPLDVNGPDDQDLFHRIILDLKRPELRERRRQFLRSIDLFDTAGLAAPAYQHLCLEHDRISYFFSDARGLLRVRGHMAADDSHAGFLEQFCRLIFVDLHLLNTV